MAVAFLVLLPTVLVLVVMFLDAPKDWCRTCRHQRSDHAEGDGACRGDEFTEDVPTGTCRCAAYVPRRGRST
ncbi:hypothetical protein ACSNOK_17555 [Streptomyces sp. URMC 126]|uniref:hypothetical protein n=1 Tax=Streptomyces sp. URMC 126 TaxID=3423401 RepID=UPI003F1DB984